MNSSSHNPGPGAKPEADVAVDVAARAEERPGGVPLEIVPEPPHQFSIAQLLRMMTLAGLTLGFASMVLRFPLALLMVATAGGVLVFDVIGLFYREPSPIPPEPLRLLPPPIRHWQPPAAESDAPTPEPEPFQFSLQQLFRVMTLAAVALGAGIMTPQFPLLGLLCLISVGALIAHLPARWLKPTVYALGILIAGAIFAAILYLLALVSVSLRR